MARCARSIVGYNSPGRVRFILDVDGASLGFGFVWLDLHEVPRLEAHDMVHVFEDKVSRLGRDVRP